jgi:hypothetical protein
MCMDLHVGRITPFVTHLAVDLAICHVVGSQEAINGQFHSYVMDLDKGEGLLEKDGNIGA